MDPPQRANAAQMAARNIKSKPKGPGRNRPLTGNVPPMSPMNNSGGALFGGSVQSPGAFNFSAPTPGGISFPDATSFGNPFANNPQADNQDPRADTTGEEEARRRKGKSLGDSVPLFADPNAPFSAPTTYDQLSTQTPSFGGFGASAAANPTANSAFTFSATPAANPAASTANNPFSFQGSTSQGIQNNSNPAFGGFGGNNSLSVSKPAENFTFGGAQSQQAPTTQNNPFNFNSPSVQKKPASSPLYNPFASSQLHSSSSLQFATNNSGSSPSQSQFANQISTDPSGNATASAQEPAGNMLGRYKIQSPAQQWAPPSPFANLANQNQQNQQGTNFNQHQQGSVFNQNPQPSFANQQSSFAGTPNDFATQQSSFAGTPNDFANQQSSFAGTPSDFANQQSSFAGNPSIFANQQSESSSGQYPRIFGNEQQSAVPYQPPYFTNHIIRDSIFANSEFYQTPNNASQSFGGPTMTNGSFGSTFGGFGTQTNTSSSFSGFGNQSLGGSSMPQQENAPSSTFNAAPAVTAPSTSNIFGSVATSAPSSNMFGATAPAPSTSNMFGTVPAPAATPVASNSNMFGTVAAAAPAPASSSSNMFGAVAQTTSASTPNMFGTVNAPVPANTSFIGTPKPYSSSVFPPAATSAPGNSSIFASSTPATSSVFNQTAAAPASNPFANLAQPKEAAPVNIFGNANGQTNGQSSAQPESIPNTSQPAQTPFGGVANNSTSTPNLFGNLNKPVDPQLSQPSTAVNGADNAQGQTKSGGASLFAKPNEVHSSPKPSFASLPSTSNSGGSSIFASTGSGNGNGVSPSPFKPVDAPLSANQPQPNGMFGGLSQPAKTQQTTNESPRKPMSPTAPGSLSNGHLSGGASTSNVGGPTNDNPKLRYEITDPSEEEMNSIMPPDFGLQQRRQFYAGFRIRALNKAIAQYFRNLPFNATPKKALAWYNQKKDSILAEYGLTALSGKRSSRDVDDDDNENQENEEPPKRPRRGTNSNQGFRDRPQRVPSPEKRSRTVNEPQPQVNGNSFMNAPSLKPTREQPSPTKAPVRDVVPQPPSAKKRKPESQLTKDEAEGNGNAKKHMNGEGSSTSNMFKNILDSPDKPVKSTSPERRIAGGSKESSSASEAPRANPFGNLPGAAPIFKKPTNSASSFKPTTSAPIATPVKPPTFSSAPVSTTPTVSPVKPATFAGAASGGIKPPTFAGAPTGGIKPPTFAGAPTGGVKPPSFGSGPVNFMAQFGQQAAKNAEDEEKKRMERIKAEDFDSEDDDEAEWVANYKAKRKAELEELENIAKTGKSFSFSDKSEASKSANSSFDSTTAPKSTPASIFAPVAAASSKNESKFSSSTPSRAPTPSGGTFSSTGSVLGGAAAKAPLPGNIFGHLSDPDSLSKDNDGDDESSESDEDESDEETEAKDPNYIPRANTSTPSVPGTPASETGAGIASAKKPATEPSKFSLGSTATSGTSTPTSGAGGSLSSRMSREPATAIPATESKANSKPKNNIFGSLTSTNPFASSVGSTASGTSDKTWKPDSPIKFGNASTTTPLVNVTGSTPTKSPFAGLLGSVASTKASGPATVGFQFGGPSSAASSLFPSAVVSTGTSRATSPGAITDADTAEAGDAEKPQAQINLTGAGPGEENEENIFQVRAKALKFISKGAGDNKSSPWETKGLGPLRVLKHKKTNVTRILLRSDPTGVIVLNKYLISQNSYKASGKTIKFSAASDNGDGLETWILQVKDESSAIALAAALEENKKYSS